MGFSLRSLLLAAIVISNCITWTASRHSYIHNVSGHRRRHRRQGGTHFLPNSYVIPGGEGSEKGWGPWGPESPCSRTCGGGVASQKRICLTLGPGSNCTGGDTKYFSCNTHPCPNSSLDFRAEQCASFNGKPFHGKTYDWVPYTNGPRPCELNCMPKGERFYYRQAIKVVDGTLCNDESFDVCVNGECQPVGCNFMLGSDAREDKCRICRGNGTKCHTNAGLIDDTDLPLGYNDILLIPEGATNIVIEEIDKSNNYLALRSKQDNKYYLNGNYEISFPHRMQIAGTRWHYIRDVQGFAAPDKLRCLGPIEEPLYLSLLLQETNVGVRYEYSIPEDKAPHPETQYTWAHDEFSPCSVSCGTGFKTRNVTCREKDLLDIAEDRMCDAGLRPIANETCQLAECLPEWVPSPWGPCSKLCGTGGSQARQVQCQKIISNGYPSIVDENQCFRRLGDKPEEHQKCNVNATCPTWFTGPWKPCDKLCGDGKQTRQVVCHRKTNGRVEVLVDSSCEDEKPETEQPCNIHPCDGIDWVISNWTGCDSCVSKFYTREAKCVTKDWQVVEPELCSYHRKPELQKPCEEASLLSCESQWYATQWSNCSVDCGKGEKTRKVFCGFFDGGAVQEVDESKCDAEAKYNDTTPCEVSADECPAIWFAADWSECTKECDGGQQFRKVMCLSGGNSSTSCPEDEMPDVEQSCNVKPCNIDELISVSSTTVMDDDDLPDCEDEDEVGAELFTSTSLSDMMFSDASSTTLEGSGASETEFDFSSFSTVTGTDTTDTGSGDTDLTTDSSTTGSGETTESSVTGETTESSVADTGSTTTDSTGTGSTDSTVSSGTDSESTDSTVSGETTVTSSTDASSKDASTGTGGSPGSTTKGGPTVAGETKAPGLAGTGPTTSSGTTVSGPTEESSAPGSSTSDGPSASGLSTTEGTSVSGSGTTVSGTAESDATTDKSSDESPTTSSEPTETTSDATTSSSDSTSDSSTTVSDGTTTVSVETTTASGGTTKDKDATTTAVPLKGETTIAPSISATSADPRSTTSSSTAASGDTTVTGGSTLSSSDSSASTTESGTGSTETTVEGSTVSTETGPTSDSSSTSIGSTVSGGSSLSTTESSGSTDSVSTTESGSSTTDVSGSSEGSSGSTTEGGSESTVSGGTSDSEGTTGLGASETTTESGTGSTTGGSTSSYDETTGSDETTGWDLSTILSTTKRCRPKNKPAKCVKSKFGCCPDKKTPAGGPFDEGCPNPTTCKDTKYGCCPDGVSPAGGPHNRDCPVPDCKETLYGCCKSDRKTPAEGNDQEGCPPKCKLSKFGCCADNETQATGPHKAGCPETSTTELSTEATTESGATESTEFSTTEVTTEAVTEACEIINGTEKCHPCSITEFGCCDDGDTAAHGPNKLGCCLLSAHGCCPDNLQPASGPDGEGCNCKNSTFGCCPDGKHYATGADNSGCGCEHAPHGCCPDRHTEANGPNFEGCSCHTFQFGCCPDGTTTAEGPNQQGCRCERSKHGCCGDGVTAATGPNQEGCDCASSKYGCCLDGITEAQSKNFSGCAEAPINKQAACGLAYEQGPCTNYSVQWFYDTDYGGCSRFHYGGCGGNGNRFADKAECEDVCVHPAGKDACRLPAVKASCTNNLSIRWYWDDSYQACLQFHYGGCLGNANKYLSREECEKKCSPRLNPEDTCTLALDKGPCAGNFSRWGYNEETGRCEEFLWGGCEGNNNRFPSEAACILKCDQPGKQQPACEQPQDAGNCTEMLPYWSFSQEEQRCVPFYYGGCGGNDNKFTDQKSCDDACPKAYEKDKCTLPADAGNCRSNFTLRWFFDTKHQQCRQFPYGGCGGNENNFLREEICNSECNRPVPRPPTPQDICQLPQDMGPCRNFVTRWYFDRIYQQCRQFYYGGCKGNANNFQTQEECQSGCVRPIAPPTEPTPTDICTLPRAEGSCRDARLRYYFDPRAGRCAPFTYGGCGGNKNNFASEQECQQRCSPVPVPPPVPAECRVASISQCVGVGRVWYLEPRSGRCTPYDPRPGASSCQLPGVFSSPEACERACGDFREIDPCKLPLSAGNCTERIESWYYDEERDDCGEFYYTGCSGNDNRFASRDECLGKCKTGAEPPPENEQCLTPTSLEACGDDFPGFYYDHIQRRCLSAPIGGCTENPNNYRTEEECERTCGSLKGQDVCRAPLDPGPCRENHPKFYWNLREGRCEAYTYGGCNGGPNRFSNQEECEEVCGHLTIDPSENEVVECAAQAAACERLRCEFGITRSKDAYGCESCSCDPNPCADIVCPPGTRCDLVPERDLATGEPKYTSQCRPADCSAEKARCASLDCPLSKQTTRGPDGCERCECVRPEPNCQPFVEECNALKCNYGPITRTTDADGCERCTCIAHPCEGKRCPEGQRCVVSASRDAITGDTQYSGDCGTVDKPGTCPAEQGSAGSCHVECNDDADCRGVQKCCRSGCSQLCRAPAAPENNVQQPAAPQAPEPNTETEREVTSSLGGTATLRCLFHSNPPPLITWKKGEITIDGTQGRYRLTSDGALQIVSLYRDDSGVYICVGQNELGSSQQEIVLNVAGPVEGPAGIVGETESNVIGDVGHALRVRCLVYGYPEPSIAWYHRPTDTMVPYDSAKYELRGSEMLIKSLDIDTLGDYTCQAYNGLGKPAAWTVTVRAERPAGSRAASPYLLQRGAPAPPRTERPATPRLGSPSYVDIPPAPPQFTVPVRTTLRAQQTALATGGILELSCEVDGHPEPRVYWTKDNAQLAESDRIYITPARLSVSRLVEEDAGVYGCHADNGHSSHHSVVQISVQKLYIPDLCKDNQYFADCKLIVRSKLCRHEYYSKFCCKSCVEAGALDAQTLEFQGDDAFTYKKK